MRKFAWIMLVAFPFLLTSCSTKAQPPKQATPPSGYETYASIPLDIIELAPDHFKGKLPWPYPCVYTVAYPLGEDYCVGDRVQVYYSDLRELDHTEKSVEWTAQVTAVYVEPSSFSLDPNQVYKPVIYLYPEQATKVTVRLEHEGTLTHTWPRYQNGWQVTAYPDGTLMEETGIQYPYLFWEGVFDLQYDMSQGFCIKGSNSEMFLQESLARLGLNQEESADFMEFWLPYLEQNPYNLISFQGSSYVDHVKFSIDPVPDTVIRVFMVFTPLQEAIDLPPQELISPERAGFTVVEWGGAVATPKH